MNIQAYIERIEDFTGHDYGDAPRVVNKEEYIEEAIASIISKKDFMFLKAEDVREDIEGLLWNSAGCYHHETHSVSFFDKSECTIFHELMHGYTKNNWPAFDSKLHKDEALRGPEDSEYFTITQGIYEGISDYVAMSISDTDDRWKEKVIELGVLGLLSRAAFFGTVEYAHLLNGRGALDSMVRPFGYKYLLAVTQAREGTEHKKISVLLENLPSLAQLYETEL